MTTDSNHGFHVYPNLAAGMELTGIDQMWTADITYIRLEAEFVYLAVVLDAYSHQNHRAFPAEVVDMVLRHSVRSILAALDRIQHANKQSDPTVKIYSSLSSKSVLFLIPN